MYCQACKSNIDREGAFCPKCGSVLLGKPPEGKLPFQEQRQTEKKIEPVNSAVELAKQEDISSSTTLCPAETPYYQEQFSKIDQKNGKRSAAFQWMPLLFGPFWYIYKGMWAKGSILLGIGFFTGGMLIPFLSLYTGFYGTYDYYLYKVKNQQL